MTYFPGALQSTMEGAGTPLKLIGKTPPNQRISGLFHLPPALDIGTQGLDPARLRRCEVVLLVRIGAEVKQLRLVPDGIPVP